MACTRVVERILAATGKLSEAPTIFKKSLDVTNGGVLWAIPALLKNGLLHNLKDNFGLPNGFYSLIHIFILLAFMALSRIKTSEQLRYSPPGELGKLLGLDRIPEVRTLRKKINILSRDDDQVSDWSRTLCREWMIADPEAAGILYIDGHVRAYYGSKTKLPRRYVSRERLCLRGTTDYWVNDKYGRPFFVISSPLTSGLISMIKTEIVPKLLEDIPNQPSKEEFKDNPKLHRFTLVFDREGYSPDLFKEMRELKIACLTYNKFPKGTWAEKDFKDRTVTMPYGEKVTMKLAEKIKVFSNGLECREIRKLGKHGHQTSVLSTDYISTIESLSAHMFSRWTQENFFKYMIQHFNFDRLLGTEASEISETSKVINPKYRELDYEIRKKTGILNRRIVKFGSLSLDHNPKKVEEYEFKKSELKVEIDVLREIISVLKEQRKKTNRHIFFKDLPEEDKFIQIAPTKKKFMDTIRMIAYRAETAMVIILRDVLARTDDARSLAREIFTTEVDLIPDKEKETLTVGLHHLTNRLSDNAVSHLAKELNKTETIYPGTNLRLIFKLVSEKNPLDQDV